MMELIEEKRGDRWAVANWLIANGTRPEKARLYADSYCEYREAQASIAANGAVVQDARSGAAIKNPYLPVRDNAFKRLEALHKAGVKPSGLW